MAEIKPFQALRYNLAKVGRERLSELICPPYDAIGLEAQLRFLKRNPFNIVRLELGEVQKGDNSNDNRYTRAAATLKEWERVGLVVRDEKPAFFLYVQEFSFFGTIHRRQALVTALKLEEYGRNIIIPHERTLPHALADRLALLETIQTNLSPIFCLFEDEKREIAGLCQLTLEKKQPLYHITDEWGERHYLYQIDDKATSAALERAFLSKKLYIADGHHRYQTALDYRSKLLAGGYPNNGSANYILAGLTAFNDPGLVITPLHRLIFNPSGGKINGLKAKLSRFFDLKEIPLEGETEPAVKAVEIVRLASEAPDPDSRPNRPGNFLGMYRHVSGEKNQFTLLKLKENPENREMMAGHSSSWQSLDVAVLHTLILENCLGLDEASQRNEEILSYTRDPQEAFTRVDRGETQVAFLLAPTPLESLRAVADAHEQMPPKSTYFYPKFSTGLVMRPLLPGRG